MLTRLFKHDTLVLGLLLLLGAAIIGAVFLSARSSIDSLVRQDAAATTARLAEEIRAAREAAGQAGDAVTIAADLRARLAGQSWTAAILAFSAYDADDRLILTSETVTTSGLRGSAAQVFADPPRTAAARDGRTVVRLSRREGEASRVLADIARPLLDRQGRPGTLFATLDQTDKYSLVGTALDAIAGLMAALIWVAVGVPGFIVWRRIKEQSSAQARIRHLAHHDPLTDLPNRLEFNGRLAQALARSRRSGGRVAVLCLDLDRFKEVNDTLGHQTGDTLLANVARRLLDGMREIDTVGRLGGDEFAVIAEDFHSSDDMILVAKRLCEALGEPHLVNGHEVACSASIGIAVSPEDGIEPFELLKNADLALYRAKQDGRATFRFFEQDMDRALQKRRRIEQDMRHALQVQQFTLHYQPQLDLQTGALCGHEALLRWAHPEVGDIPPGQFIPIAEESGLIIPIGAWVLRRACLDAMTWPSHLKVAVNMSPAQFMSNDVIFTVAEILRETGLAPERLEIEITENLLLGNTDLVLDQLNRLHAMGVGIAMDDFGTGYSSLSYLSRFPFSKIKIDGSFIRNMNKDANTTAIVSTIINLGKSLNVTITAEGVETTDQADALRSYGCKQVQGFLFGRPADAAETSRRHGALAPAPSEEVDDMPLPEIGEPVARHPVETLRRRARVA